MKCKHIKSRNKTERNFHTTLVSTATTIYVYCPENFPGNWRVRTLWSGYGSMGTSNVILPYAMLGRRVLKFIIICVSYTTPKSSRWWVQHLSTHGNHKREDRRPPWREFKFVEHEWDERSEIFSGRFNEPSWKEYTSKKQLSVSCWGVAIMM